ncbi:hypothetical protein Cgig2_019785 [Carnegiea gigantea]|uniref:Uncharacterized protein n=1 Tax=Carnegiea gigantea TaxID=171969 RepID=A0A9Q1KF03_9CARY|nr:hypothetical protein Cgig2_019785 [Carnegiea gigantea]
MLFLLYSHLGHSFILLEFAHSTVTNKVSLINPTTRTRPSIDSLLARQHDTCKEELSKGKVPSTRLKHDILQAHSDKEKGYENSASNDAMISGGKLTVTRNAINPSENDSPDNEGIKQFGKLHGGKDGKVPNIAEIFKATQKRKDGTLNEEDAALYLEASHQKKISDMEASHQRHIGELLKEIKLLKNLVLPQQHNTATLASAP